MRKIEFAHEILSESRRSTQIYLESGRDYDKVKANMYSVFECYAHGLISWNQVRSRWHSSILEYLNLYADRPDLYLSESNRMLGEYETTLQTHKPALDEYKRVNEQKMTSNIVVKGKLNESQAKEQSNVYFNRRTLKESELKDTVTMKTWKRVQESYPNLTSKDELRIRMLTIFEGSTVDTTKLVTTYMSEEPTAISGPMQTSMRPKPRPVATANNSLADVYPPRGDMEMDPANMAKRSSLAPTTSPRPMPRPVNLGNDPQGIGAGSQVAYMDNGAVDGSTRGIDPADAYSPEDLARLTGQPAPSLAPTTSPRPMPRPKTLKQSANNNIRKEAAAIFNRIKVAANEGYKVLPPMDKERYTEIPGLEGPFTTLSGKVVYYDPKEGAYYDRDTDMYLSNDEYTALNSDYSGMQDERDINVREGDIPLAHPNYMDTKNNPEILSAFEKQRQNWLKTNPRGGEVDDLNDLVNFGNKVSKIGNPKAAATLTKGSMDYFKNNPGRGLGEAKAKPGHNARVMANNLSKVFKAKPDFLDMDKDGDKEEPMKKAAADSKKKVDEKAKWRSSSAAKKITDPDKDLGMADYDYHHENPRSTGRLKSTADTEPSDGSINNRAKSKTNSMGKRKGMVSKADINRVKSNAFNTLNKDKVDEAPLLGPQGKIHRAASADQSDREYASQKSFKDAWTAKNVGKKWPGYSEAGYKHPAYKKEESAVNEAVTLDYSRYMRAHGKKPRDAGMGSSTWMFTTSEFGDPSENEIFQFRGSFADAKKAAAKWTKSQGEYRFYVMESFNKSVKEADSSDSDLKVWEVYILNNYYNGKYADYGARPYPVLAASADEAKQVVLDNADAILKDLLSKKLQNGKRVLPPNSAIAVSDKEIGRIEDGTVKGRRSTMNGYSTYFSPNGPLTVKLKDGNVVEIQGQQTSEVTNEAGGIGGGMSGTKFSKAADYAPAVGAGVRGAVDNFTIGTGKYARAAADYGIKNLGSLAGISDPTTWDTEINQELEKDQAAQRDYPVAWDIGDKVATAAQVASGVGAVKALGTAAVRAGLRAAADSAARKAAAKVAAKKADDNLRYQARGMSNAELANATKFSKNPALTRELQRRQELSNLPDLPVVNDFELGMRNALNLTRQMRVPPTPLKLTPNQMIPRSSKIVPFPKKP